MGGLVPDPPGSVVGGLSPRPLLICFTFPNTGHEYEVGDLKSPAGVFAVRDVPSTFMGGGAPSVCSEQTAHGFTT